MIKQELLEELTEKKSFIQGVGEAMTDGHRISVTGVAYEVYEHKDGYVQEYLVVRYSGGAIAARNCNCNSNSANFRELANLINGGYYGEVKKYTEIRESGEWKKIL